MTAQVLLALACLLLLAATVSDLRTRTVSNSVPLGLIGLFPLAVLLAPEVLTGPAAAHALLALGLGALGLASFSLGFLGGADGKLMAATALWAGPADILFCLLGMGLVGLGMAGMACLPFPVSRRWREGLPYTVAVAIPAVAALGQRAWLNL